MGLKVGINGFGRIGRNILRAALGNAELDFVAVNDLTDTKTLAHLLKYDSILGNLHQEVTASGDAIHVAGEALKVLSVKDPSELPWKELGVDIVFESTGRFTDRDAAAKIRRSTTSSRTPRARRTALPRSPKCSTSTSASSAAG
jgi:glyceraldehyde 3-phosphate dehydrogenase